MKSGIMARKPSDAKGALYLGAPYNMETKALAEEPTYYRSKDLVTHGVCIGMTGSGKTGLCVALLEECALSGIPVLAIDPKGDLTNLKLAFPDLRGEDLAPFIPPDAADSKGMTLEDFAAKQAETWKNGLADWGLDGGDIRRFRDAVDVQIFTPGSTAGKPLDILRSLDPPQNIDDLDDEFVREEIAGVVSAVLGLVGRGNASPHDREHILPATLLEMRWRAKQPTTLPDLINLIQSPPIQSLGALDLESFYPEAERRKFAFDLNGLVASPSFQTWLRGEPLDIDGLLRAPDGRPRLSILYIAHLGDAERMFFVTLLLNQLVTWMRRQQGTSDLRALLYFDEIAGYLPPHPGNPPSKRLLMTLLKQGRAFGTSAMLVTQNPVDLDYKALSNCGTWMLGKLQTEQDKARILDGLQSAAGEAGGSMDRRAMDALIGRLGQRVFLLHNVHADSPQVIHSRWVMSYLAGPLTRQQIRIVQPPEEAVAAPTPRDDTESLSDFLGGENSAPSETSPSATASLTSVPPSPPRGLSVAFDPQGIATMMPHLFFRATVTHRDRASGASHAVACFASLDPAGPLDWKEADFTFEPPCTSDSPPAGGRFVSLPSALQNVDALKVLGASIADFLIERAALDLQSVPEFKLRALPGETEEDFLARVDAEAASRLAAQTGKIEADHESKSKRLAAQIEAARAHLDRDRERAATYKQQEMAGTLTGLGTTLLSIFTGRKGTAASKIGSSIRTASNRRATSQRAGLAVQKSEDTLTRLEEQLAELDSDRSRSINSARAGIEAAKSSRESIRVAPAKTNIRVEAYGVFWRNSDQAAGG